MRHILKQSEPDSFRVWKEENNVALEQKYLSETGTRIWDWFTNTPEFANTRNDLKYSLLQEQGYICCYCGQSIDNDFPTAIEHFMPKSKNAHKKLILDYSNLMISCKCSHIPNSNLPFILFKETKGYDNLETTNQISEKAGCSTKKLRLCNPSLPQNPRNRITELNKGDKIYLYIKHCDDKKADSDVGEIEFYVLNPLVEVNLGEKFKYNSDGYIELINVEENIKVNMLEKVLNLNAHNLCELRSQEVLAAKNYKNRLQQDFENGFISEEELIYEISSQELTDENNRRQPFCFIYSYVLKQLFL